MPESKTMSPVRVGRYQWEDMADHMQSTHVSGVQFWDTLNVMPVGLTDACNKANQYCTHAVSFAYNVAWAAYCYPTATDTTIVRVMFCADDATYPGADARESIDIGGAALHIRVSADTVASDPQALARLIARVVTDGKAYNMPGHTSRYTTVVGVNGHTPFTQVSDVLVPVMYPFVSYFAELMDDVDSDEMHAAAAHTANECEVKLHAMQDAHVVTGAVRVDGTGDEYRNFYTPADTVPDMSVLNV